MTRALTANGGQIKRTYEADSRGRSAWQNERQVLVWEFRDIILISPLNQVCCPHMSEKKPAASGGRVGRRWDRLRVACVQTCTCSRSRAAAAREAVPQRRKMPGSDRS